MTLRNVDKTARCRSLARKSGIPQQNVLEDDEIFLWVVFFAKG